MIDIERQIDLECVADLIGAPWREGAQGPDEFDCWGLARFVQRELFGRELPIAGIAPEQIADVRAVMRAIQNHPVRAEWIEAIHPQHGNLVTMAHHNYASHIGVFLDIDRGAVLHTTKDAGVSFDTIHALKLKGFARLQFYRHIDTAHAG